ncbi:MAG: FdhD protein [Mycobacterium sp.]|nr:FdhD protein [Mycobacterium sp.]
MGRVTSRYRVLRMVDGVATARPDTLAAEEPLEIRVAGRPLSVTMRTPGDDFDLARGFLVSEGVVATGSDISAIRYCAGATADGSNTYNVLDVVLAEGVPLPDPSVERNFYTTSSCGLCGKASLEAVRTTSKWHVDRDPVRLTAATIATLPEKLRAAQRVFDRTGGLHAAGLFDANGDSWCVREDVGRHNAVDKVIGWGLGAGRLPLSGTTLMVSGRASFELVQKAVMAGIPALAAVSAPSSLAVDLAREMGLTLIGFLRGSSMNVYSAGERFDTVEAMQYGPAMLPTA